MIQFIRYKKESNQNFLETRTVVDFELKTLFDGKVYSYVHGLKLKLLNTLNEDSALYQLRNTIETGQEFVESFIRVDKPFNIHKTSRRKLWQDFMEKSLEHLTETKFQRKQYILLKIRSTVTIVNNYEH